MDALGQGSHMYMWHGSEHVFNNDGIKNILGISFDTQRFKCSVVLRSMTYSLNYALLDSSA